jgi:hypothetical protein
MDPTTTTTTTPAPAPAASGRPPGPAPLTAAQRWLAAATGLGSTGLAVLAGIGSFGAVAQVARAHGFQHPGQVPLVVDLGIFALILADLLLTWLGMPFGPLRWLPWLFVGATVWFNAAASWGDPLGMAMHAAAPVLLVTWVEAVRHATRTRARMAQRRHIEAAQLGRWLLAPLATARLWRTQQLWHIASYADALALERRRLLAIARMRAKHGPFWRWRAPVQERLVLRFGLEAAAATQPAEDEPPPAKVQLSRTDPRPSPGTRPETRPGTRPGTAGALSPPKPAPPSPRRPRGSSRGSSGGTKRRVRGETKADRIRAHVTAERAAGRNPSPGEVAAVLGVDKAQTRRVMAALPAPNGKAPAPTPVPVSQDGGRPS